MTTTKPIAEQVAELKVGDWVEIGTNYGNRTFFTRGYIYAGGGVALLIGDGQVIRYNNGEVSQFLTSITRVPRPIPSEPAIGHFALLNTGVVTHRVHTGDAKGCWYGKFGTFLEHIHLTWSEIYPHIIKLYTPSGDLVTGFEYAKGGQGDE